MRRSSLTLSATGWLGCGVFVDSLGLGLWLTLGVLYLVHVVGLSPGAVGAVLSVAAIGATLLGLPLGRIADRYGARRILAVSAMVETASLLLLLAVDGLIGALVAVCVYTAAAASVISARNALISNVVGKAGRVEAQARLRVAANAATALGSGLAAIVLVANRGSAYRGAVAFDAATSLVWLLVLRRLRLPAGARQRASGDLAPFRDLPFAAVAILNGVLNLTFLVLSVALPVWVTAETSAPSWLVSPLLLLNSVFVMLFQVRASRVASTVDRAKRAMVVGGAWGAVGCVIMGTAGLADRPLAIMILVAATLTLSVSEVFVAAGGWTLSYECAPPTMIATYQGVFGAGLSLRNIIGPALMLGLVVEHAAVGWPLLAALFGAAGLLIPVVCGRFLQRTPTAESF